MKKLYCIIVMSFCLVFVFAMESYAQVEDPFEQSTLKVPDNKPLPPERPVVKKKPKKEKPAKEVIIVEKEVPAKPNPEPQKPVQEVKISNPCNDKLSVMFISLNGNRASQELDWTIKFINHDVNKRIYVRNIRAYDEDGNENQASLNGWDTKTDIPIKAAFHFDKKVLPSKISKMSIITCEIDNCEVEFRDVPINWQ